MTHSERLLELAHAIGNAELTMLCIEMVALLYEALGQAVRLQKGECPCCGNPMLNVDVSREHGLRWSCLEGCNP